MEKNHRIIDWIKRLIDTKNEREIKRIRPYVGKINELEPEYQRLSDAELKEKTEQFKKRIAEATAGLNKDLEEARNEAVTVEPDQREELKNSVDELDKELRQKESEVLERAHRARCPSDHRQ